MLQRFVSWEAIVPRVLAFLFCSGLSSLSPLCILHSHLFRLKCHREKLKCLPVPERLAGVLFSFAFLSFFMLLVHKPETDFQRNERPVLTGEPWSRTGFGLLPSQVTSEAAFPSQEMSKQLSSVEHRNSRLLILFKIPVAVEPFFTPEQTWGEAGKASLKWEKGSFIIPRFIVHSLVGKKGFKRK